MKILAIMSSPTVHTLKSANSISDMINMAKVLDIIIYMAADALKRAADKKGIEIKIETRGSVGIENQITSDDIKSAQVLILAVDTDVNVDLFNQTPIVRIKLQEAIKNASGVIEKALETKLEKETKVVENNVEISDVRTGIYQHLMNGVSYMIPIVAAGGLLITCSFIFGIDAFQEKGTLAAALMDIGGGTAFSLMIAVLSGYIAFSIANKPGLAPGLVGGMLAFQIGAGFLGGIISGFLAGYIALFIKSKLILPKSFDGLKPVLIIPFFSTLLTGLLMIYVIGTPVKFLMEILLVFLTGLNSINAAFLGLLLGSMIAIDMGGPINKAAYAFSVALLTSSIYEPMAAVMSAGMTPPLGIALATFIARNKFTKIEKEAGKVSGIMGLSFITEGAIPFAASDPFRVIPCIVVGSATAAALSMFFDVSLKVPHGGIFVLLIPGAVGNLGLYILSILIGTLITTFMLIILKKNVNIAI